jgi:hypothetical protein
MNTKSTIVFLVLSLLSEACSSSAQDLKLQRFDGRLAFDSPPSNSQALSDSKIRIERIIQDHLKSDSSDNKIIWTSMLKQVEKIEKGAAYCPKDSGNSPRNLKLNTIPGYGYLLEVWCSLGASTPPNFLLLKYTEQRGVIPSPVQLEIPKSGDVHKLKTDSYLYFGYGNYDLDSKLFVVVIPTRCTLNIAENNCKSVVKYLIH